MQVSLYVISIKHLRAGPYGMNITTVVPTKSDSDVILCSQLLSKTFTCTLHLK